MAILTVKKAFPREKKVFTIPKVTVSCPVFPFLRSPAPNNPPTISTTVSRTMDSAKTASLSGDSGSGSGSGPGSIAVSTPPTVLSLTETQPTVDIDQVQLQFDLQGLLQQLCVQNNIMYLVLASLVFRIDLERPTDVGSFLLPPGESPIVGAWLDPTGAYLLVQTLGKTTYHLHRLYSKFKPLPRFKGFGITAVAFPESPVDAVSSAASEPTAEISFLVGSVDGHIYSAQLKVHASESKRDDRHLKLLYKLSGGSPVSGIAFTRNSLQVSVVHGSSLLQWDCFDTSSSELTRVFRTPPQATSLPLSGNALFDADGQSYTYLIPSTNEIRSSDPETALLADKINTGGYFLSSSKNSLLSTKHHYLLLNSQHDALLVASKLGGSPPLVVGLSSLGRDTPLGITADRTGHTYWLYTRNSIHELVISNEAASVWHSYYKMGRYADALRCLEDDANQAHRALKKDIVLVKQGYSLLQEGGFGVDSVTEDLWQKQLKGVRTLAELLEPFEKVCLMLMGSTIADFQGRVSLANVALLVEYLEVKLETAKSEKSQIRTAVLSSWILERLLRGEVSAIEQKSQKNNNHASGLFEANGGSNTALFDSSSRLTSFLEKNHRILDAPTVYQLMTSVHSPDHLIAFAELIADHKFLLNYYIDLENWTGASNTLISLYKRDVEAACEAAYFKATVLLVNSPKTTTEIWLQLSELDPERLIPAILAYNKNNRSIPLPENHSLHYLLRLVYDKGVRSRLINNCFLSLLITYPLDNNDKQAARHRTRQITKLLHQLKDGKLIYDADFVLRLCLRHEQFHPAILVLINDFELYEQALKLALAHELTELAEFVLKKFDESVLGGDKSGDLVYRGSTEEESANVGKIRLEEESYSARKKLWMLFAEYLIHGVCEGKKFSILNTVGESPKPDEEKVLKNGTTEKDTVKEAVKDITLGLLESMTSKPEERPPQLASGDLNRTLRYLLNFSYTNNSSLNVLTLKDLLPLFPESIMINNFKDEIVQSLNQYNTRIGQLSLEMHELTNIAAQLKAQIHEFATTPSKGRVYTVIEPGEPCRICRRILLDRNFVCFPNCHHNFHKDCLVRYYLQLKGDYRFKKIFQTFKRNATLASRVELDEIMLSECVLCNDGNINTIDINLVDDKERLEMAEWEL